MFHVCLPKKMNQKKTPSIMSEMEGKFVEMFGDGDGTRAGNGTGTRERTGNGTFVQSVLRKYYNGSANPLTSPPAKLPL
jgi:hypothetical protein